VSGRRDADHPGALERRGILSRIDHDDHSALRPIQEEIQQGGPSPSPADQADPQAPGRLPRSDSHHSRPPTRAAPAVVGAKRSCGKESSSLAESSLDEPLEVFEAERLAEHRGMGRLKKARVLSRLRCPGHEYEPPQ